MKFLGLIMMVLLVSCARTPVKQTPKPITKKPIKKPPRPDRHERLLECVDRYFLK